MYQYDDYDRTLVRERVAQFRDQVQRRLADELSEEEFLPLRLQNGLYLQKHAYMLRVAIPYGTLSAKQMRALAHIAREYDRGYGHFTTRQNIQFNWIELERVPDILDWLADHDMHAIQTSGNCVRNVTTEAFAGVAADEYLDPRPLAEILRQWSTVNPEFLFLPRKFKIALCAAEQDRAAVQVHDIGLQLYRDEAGELRLRVLVGGGLGRTPIIAQTLREGLHWQDCLSYVEAILRVYNRHGRRDNKYKARIKILVKALGAEKFRELTEAEFAELKDGPITLTADEVDRMRGHFSEPAYDGSATDQPAALTEALASSKAFNRWYHTNVHAHRQPGYAAVTLTLKKTGRAPGDITDTEFDAVADLADQYSFGELRTTHQQNIVLGDVRQDQLFALWEALEVLGFATPNLKLLTDIIACPGGDFCSLANAKSIPIAEAIQRHFEDMDYLHDLGPIDLNISGCMNACGHHHIGHIGILGVDKKGREYYQITLGGRGDKTSRIGEKLGPSFEADEVVPVIARLVDLYVEQRQPDELFIDTYERLGIDPFKERAYASHH